VADGTTLKRFDVSGNPLSPQLVAVVPLPDFVNSICAANGLVYLACRDAGLLVMNAYLTATYSSDTMGVSPGQALDVAVLQSIAVVADGSGGVRVFDVSQTNPRFLRALATPDAACGVKIMRAASGSLYAYVAAMTSGLFTVDVSTPSQASIVGVAASRDVAFGIDLFGEYACVANGGAYFGAPANGLQVFSIAQPTQPLETEFLAIPGTLCTSVSILDNLAFVSQYNAPMSIYELLH